MAVQLTTEISRQIVDAVKGVCDRDVNFIGPSGIITASTNPARVGTWHSAAAKAAKEGVTIEIAPGEETEGTQPGVNIPLFHDGSVVCVIGITGAPEDVRRYAFLASSITRLLIREQETGDFLRSKQEKREYAVRALTGGEMENPEYLKECMRQLQVPEEKRMAAVRICLASNIRLGNISMIDKRITDLLSSLEIALYRFRYPNEYILLIGEKSYRKCIRKLNEFSETCAPLLTIGCGTLRELSSLRISYHEAITASDAAGQKGEPFLEYSSLDLEILLSGVDDQRKAAYRQKVLDSLSEEDCFLLRAYFQADASLAKTAETLHMHKNTLQYRLNRIHDKSGYNPREFRDGAVLYLALRAEMAAPQ